MKTDKPKSGDWADREAARIVDLAERMRSNEYMRIEIASSLRRAAHNHLLFDAVKPSIKDQEAAIAKAHRIGDVESHRDRRIEAMKLINELSQPGRTIVHITRAIEEAAAEGKNKLKYHPFGLDTKHVDIVAKHFKDEGLKIVSRQVDAGAPPMGYPEDGATILEFEFSWGHVK